MAFLNQCLGSINCASEDSIAIIAIDNCSTDQTIEQLFSFQSPRATLEYISQQDDGPAQALNTGFSMALAGGADIVGWLNSDDYYAPEAIDRAIAAFKADPKLKIVYGLGRHVDEHGKDLGAYPTLPPNTNMKQFAQGSFICQPTAFFRADVFAEVGLLDESLKTAFDFDFWLRIFKHYPRRQIGFINYVQAYSRLHSQCLTKKLRKIVALESMQVIARYLGSAPGHWVATYFDELCERYPFISESESLVEFVKNFLIDAKPFMKTSEFDRLVKMLQSDWRLRLSHQQFFIDIQPDGWIGKKTVVKFRYTSEGPKILQLQCKGAWPTPAKLTLKITASDGISEIVKLGSQDDFMLTLEAPETSTTGFTAWVIETRQSFVPAKTIKKSKDKRTLSFKVIGCQLL